MNTTDTVTETLAAACRDAEHYYRHLERNWRWIRFAIFLVAVQGVTLAFIKPEPLATGLMFAADATFATVYIDRMHRAGVAAFKARCTLARHTGATEAEMAQLVNSSAETGGDVR